MRENFNAIIIGGGPAGYVCAIRLAQLGKKVMLIEKKSTLGGTCLNVGCIPSKALLDATEFYTTAKNHSADFGVHIANMSYDLQKIMERKKSIVDIQVRGIDFLMQKNKISRVHGSGFLVSSNTVEVVFADEDLSEQYTAEFIILATGSLPVELSVAPFDGKKIISSNDAIGLDRVPEHMLVIGAGAIGLELGSVWQRLGAKVSIVEVAPDLFGGIDKQISATVLRHLGAKGINFFMQHRVLETKISDSEVVVIAQNKKNEIQEFKGDVLLVAAGRKPNLENLGLQNAGIELQPNGKIKINPETYQTTCENVYAIGDIIDGPMLAHKAEEEGVVLAEKICSLKSRLNYNTIASIVYTSPEIAWVGAGEDQLKSTGVEYATGRFLFRANARAHAMNETDGMVKIMADKSSNKILGVFIVGARASELISEATLAMKNESTVDDIIHTVHAHPTLSEAIKEAALDVQKRSIHS
ncbi:MAG: dihydrolipoyl dehydrogenase [Spirochaetia bacterium]|nr:dihydrolipoyl dehydrogenase [Spirochaetia bacterium]